MKRKYISLLAIAVSFGLLVGCSNKAEDVVTDNVLTQSSEIVEHTENVESSETTESSESTTSIETETAEVIAEPAPTVDPTVEETTPTQTQQSTNTSRQDIDMEHMHWCEQNDPSQLTEAEANYLKNKFPGFPKDPRQMTVAEFTAYMESYFANEYSDTGTTDTGTQPTDGGNGGNTNPPPANNGLQGHDFGEGTDGIEGTIEIY